MRILQVVPVLDLAGAETMCQNLAIQLHKLGHEVVVVSLFSKDTSITRNLQNAGVCVSFLDKKNGFDAKCFYRLYKTIKTFHPDVVHSHIYAGKYAHLAASFAKVGSKVYTVHSIAQEETSSFGKIINKIFFKLLRVIPVALTKEIQKSICKVYKMKDVDVPIVYNGIPLEKCHPIPIYEKEVHEIIHVGRFCDVKNHKNLVKAVISLHEERPNVILKLYGDGPLKKEIERIAKINNATGYIKFMGLTSDVYSAMATADIFVLPSLYEGMPMTLIEAMATGLPIITTPVGGIVDMLDDGIEAIFTSADSRSIAKSIETAISDVEYRELIGKNAKKKANQFSALTMAQGYCDVYQWRTMK